MPNSEHLQRNMLRFSADHVLAKVNFKLFCNWSVILIKSIPKKMNQVPSCFAIFFFHVIVCSCVALFICQTSKLLLFRYKSMIFFLFGGVSQVLFWAKEETEIERLKSRLSEFYYENLQKVNTFSFLYSILLLITFDYKYVMLIYLLSFILLNVVFIGWCTSEGIKRVAWCCVYSSHTMCSCILSRQEIHGRSFTENGPEEIFWGTFVSKYTFACHIFAHVPFCYQYL